MEPTINVGDIIIVSGIEKSNIKVDDIVTFEQEGKTITHRIVEVNKTDQGEKYVTKGDNNQVNDVEEITYEQIIGILVFKIPRIGNIILLLEDKIYVILLLNLALIIYINTRRVEEKKKMRREKKKIEDKRKQSKKNNICIAKKDIRIDININDFI